jgi:hypothetical protein
MPDKSCRSIVVIEVSTEKTMEYLVIWDLLKQSIPLVEGEILHGRLAPNHIQNFEFMVLNANNISFARVDFFA